MSLALRGKPELLTPNPSLVALAASADSMYLIKGSIVPGTILSANSRIPLLTFSVDNPSSPGISE